MPDTTYQFRDASVPAVYDSLFVPRFFVQFGEQLLSRGRVVGADLSAPMLAVARAKPAIAGGAAMAWLESPAAPLAVRDGEFDLVTCHHGLQFFPDRAAALREMRRALKPGGRLAIGVWGALSANPHFAALSAALEDAGLPAIAARSRAPFGFPELAALRAEVAAAGFDDVTADEVTFPVVYEGGVEQAASIWRAMPIAPELNAVPAETMRALDLALRRRLEAHLERGRVRAPMTSNVVTARRPA